MTDQVSEEDWQKLADAALRDAKSAVNIAYSRLWDVQCWHPSTSTSNLAREMCDQLDAMLRKLRDLDNGRALAEAMGRTLRERERASRPTEARRDDMPS